MSLTTVKLSWIWRSRSSSGWSLFDHRGEDSSCHSNRTTSCLPVFGHRVWVGDPLGFDLETGSPCLCTLDGRTRARYSVLGDEYHVVIIRDLLTNTYNYRSGTCRPSTGRPRVFPPPGSLGDVDRPLVKCLLRNPDEGPLRFWLISLIHSGLVPLSPLSFPFFPLLSLRPPCN